MKYAATCFSFASVAARALAGLAVLGCASTALAYTAIKQTKTVPGAAGPNISFNVFLPANYDDAGNTTRYSVIYHLHGAGGNYTTHNTQIVDAHEAAVARGDMAPVIIVFPDGHGNIFWGNQGTLLPEDDVMNVIIPFVDNSYRTLADRAHRVVQGFSMGGFGAAKFAAKFPEKFVACMIYDGALGTHPASFDAYSPWFHIVNNKTAINRYPVPFRQLTGLFDRPTDGAVKFEAELAANGMVHEYADTACAHNMPCLANPSATADVAASRRCWVFLQQAIDAAAGGSPVTPGGPPARIVNLSVLTSIESASDEFTMGYVVAGASSSAPKPLVVRAAGPSLGALGVTGSLADPKFELFAGAIKQSENDNWGGSPALAQAMATVGAFPFLNATSKDAAASISCTTQDNSARVAAVGSGTGKVLAEVYDATPAAGVTADTPRLVNVSVRKALGGGLTIGFVLGSGSPRSVLIRAIGPTLGAAPFNVPGVVADLQLALYNKNQAKLGENNDWGGTTLLSSVFASVGAFALPANSKDAALLVTLNPGEYSVVATGVGGTTGVGLVEVYEAP